MLCPKCNNQMKRKDGETDETYKLRWESSNCPDHELPETLR